MSAWKIAATVSVATAGVVIALFVAGWSHGLVLLAYVLFVGAVAVIALARRLRSVLPPADQFARLLAERPGPAEAAGQLRSIRRALSAAGRSQAELHSRLAPMVHEIAAARLSRRHGVDLDREPERARRLIGDGRLWELLTPGHGPADGPLGSGWSRQDLEELLNELERI